MDMAMARYITRKEVSTQVLPTTIPPPQSYDYYFRLHVYRLFRIYAWLESSLHFHFYYLLLLLLLLRLVFRKFPRTVQIATHPPNCLMGSPFIFGAFPFDAGYKELPRPNRTSDQLLFFYLDGWSMRIGY